VQHGTDVTDSFPLRLPFIAIKTGLAWTTEKKGALTVKKERTFQELLAMTRRVIQAFDAAEQRPWTIETTMIELMKQVGDLARHIMTIEQYYLPDRATDPNYATTPQEIGDELADILSCVIRVAEHYHIDLEEAHVNARRKELRYVGLEAEF
jgi:NTP pyrophosphatase (non-canonical NTP hydrolase)